MAGNSGEPGRTVTSKLAAILVAFTNGRDFTLSELAMHTNLAVSTVHRLLTDLVRTSLLERPDGITYRPGPRCTRCCRTSSQPPTLRERAPFVVEDLAASLRATARLGIVDGLEVGLRREGAPAGARHAVPQRRPAAAARDGHGQGAARLRTTVARPGPRRQRSPPLHRQDPRRPDRSRARPPEDQRPRLRPRRQRARSPAFRCRRRTRVRRPRRVDRRHRGGGGPPAAQRSNSPCPRC